MDFKTYNISQQWGLSLTYYIDEFIKANKKESASK